MHPEDEMLSSIEVNEDCLHEILKLIKETLMYSVEDLAENCIWKVKSYQQCDSIPSQF